MVQISAVIGDNGSTVQVTFVTFLSIGSSSTVGFCGDERDRFPIQQTVRANFTPGEPAPASSRLSSLSRQSSVVSEHLRAIFLPTTED